MADYNRRSRLFGAMKKEFMKAPPPSTEHFKEPFKFEFPLNSSDDARLVSDFNHQKIIQQSSEQQKKKKAIIAVDQQFLLDRDNLSLLTDELRDLETAFAMQRGYSLALLPEEKLDSQTVYISPCDDPNLFFYQVKQSDETIHTGTIAFQELGLQPRIEPFTIEEYLTVKDEILAITTKRGHTPADFELEHAFHLFCCTQLEKFYKPFNKAKWKQYQKLRMEIESYWIGKTEKKASKQEAFTIACGRKIADEIIDILNAPFHTAQLISLISFLNMYRIFWAFIRMFVFSLLAVLKNREIWEKASKFLHNTIKMNKFIAALTTTNYILYPLSIGFFVARFALVVAEIIKFTLMPGKDKSSTWFSRLKSQLKDHEIHALLINDGVWPVINGITNYAKEIAQHLPHLARLVPAAPWILFSFLFFDTGIFLYLGYRKYDQYLLERADYIKQLQDPSISPQQKNLVASQLIACDNQWKINFASIFYKITASLLIAAGFGLSLALSFLAPAAYAVSMIGVAMYICHDDFKTWQEARIKLNMAESTGKNVRRSTVENSKARQRFFVSLAINVIVPSLIIATFALSWQLALVMTAAFALYQLFRAYSTYRQGKNEQVAPEEPKSKHTITFNFAQSRKVQPNSVDDGHDPALMCF